MAMRRSIRNLFLGIVLLVTSLSIASPAYSQVVPQTIYSCWSVNNQNIHVSGGQVVLKASHTCPAGVTIQQTITGYLWRTNGQEFYGHSVIYTGGSLSLKGSSGLRAPCTPGYWSGSVTHWAAISGNFWQSFSPAPGSGVWRDC